MNELALLSLWRDTFRASHFQMDTTKDVFPFMMTNHPTIASFLLERVPNIFDCSVTGNDYKLWSLLLGFFQLNLSINSLLMVGKGVG